jgi:hypothetical protein
MKLRRDHPLLPSQLGLMRRCPLRYLIENHFDGACAIGAHPLTLLGKAIHETIDQAFNADRLLTAREFRRLVVGSVAQAIYGQAPIMAILKACDLRTEPLSVFEPAKLSERIGYGYRTFSSRWQRRGSSISVHRGATSARPRPKAERRFGPEIKMENLDCDLRGRADLVERTGKRSLRVTEFKTGRIFGDDGELAEDYRLQISAYAWMLSKEHEGFDVEMRVTAPGHQTWEREFDDAEQLYIETEIRNLSQIIPRDTDLDGDEIAQVGTMCISCRIRPSCSTYCDLAPLRWGPDSGSGELPLDSWGSAIEIEKTGDRLSRLRLLNQRGERVVVSNIPGPFLNDLAAGDPVSIFGLSSRETGRGKRYPNNFQIINTTKTYRSSFAIFISVAHPPLPMANEAGSVYRGKRK